MLIDSFFFSRENQHIHASRCFLSVVILMAKTNIDHIHTYIYIYILNSLARLFKNVLANIRTKEKITI